MKNILFKTGFIFTLFLISFALRADETEKPIIHFGINGGFNLNYHLADFKNLPSTPSCCPKFESTFYPAYNGGIFTEIPLNDKYDIGFSANFNIIPFEFIKEENIGNTAVIGVNGTSVPEKIYTEHKIDGSINTISLEAYGNYYLNKNLRLSLGLIPSYIITNTFNQKELILRPNNVVFSDNNSLARNEQNDAEINEINKFQFASSVGISYVFQQSKNFSIIPHFKYKHSFTNIATDDWTIIGGELGLSLRYSIYPSKELPIIRDTIYNIDTTDIFVFHIDEPQTRLIDSAFNHKVQEFEDRIEETYTISKQYENQILKDAKIHLSLKLTGIDSDGTIMEIPTIIIEETEYGEGFPIIPYVYFEDNQSDLANSNQTLLSNNQISSFNPEKLPWDAYQINDNTLNILAQRIQQTNARVSINGYYTLSETKSVAMDRANSVINYFVDVWGINKNRFKINTKKQKITSSKSSEPALKAEYQRVEIMSDDLSLIKPLVLKNIKKTSNPPKIKIDGSIYAETGLKDWKLNINQDGNPFRYYNGSDTSFSKEWFVTKEPVPELEKPISVVLTANDNTNNSRTKEEKIQIEQLTLKKKRVILKDDKIIEKYSLIVFDYNKSTLNDIQTSVIKDIRKNIKPNSFVTIEGYADASGSEEYNKLLAHRRTISVKKALDKKTAGYKLVPYGSSVQLFDNSTPKGRALNRTVIVTIETPVNE